MNDDADELKKQVKYKIGVKFILINVIRFLLLIIFLFAISENRKLVIFSTMAAFFLTFLPFFYKIIFKKESAAIFDIVLILLIFGLFSFWEIRGVYANSLILAFLMNSAQAIATGMLGLTVVYSFFKYSKLEENLIAVSLFSFCLAFTFGVLFELSEIILDSIFKFRIHEAGLYNMTGDLTIYFAGSFMVSLVGYHSLKKGKHILVSKFLEDLVQKNAKLFGIKQKADEFHESHIEELITKGESNVLEFKSSIRKNLHTNSFDKQIEHSILKTIGAYLNSNGGTLLIGVDDKGEILGLDKDEFSNDDHAQRHLMQLINSSIGAEFTPLIKTTPVKIDGKSLLKVDCKKSNKESFVKNGKDEHFYVRQGSLSMPLTGSALLRYIENNFRGKT